MAKFHIGRGGKAAICSAKKGNCPFGTDEEHFKTRDEAKAAAQEKLAKENNVMQSSSKKSSVKEDNSVNKDNKETDLENLHNTIATQISDNFIIYNSDKGLTDKEHKELMDNLLSIVQENSNNEINWYNIANSIKKGIDDRYDKELSNAIENIRDTALEYGGHDYESLKNLEHHAFSDEDKKEARKIDKSEIEDRNVKMLVSVLASRTRKDKLRFIAHKKIDDGMYYAELYDALGKKRQYVYFADNGLIDYNNVVVEELAVHSFDKAEDITLPKKNIFSGINMDKRKEFLAIKNSIMKNVDWNDAASISNIRDSILADKNYGRDEALRDSMKAMIDLQMSDNIIKGKTLAQKENTLDIKDLDKKETLEMFKSGVVKVKGNNLNIAENVKNDDDYKEIKNRILSRHKDFDSVDFVGRENAKNSAIKIADAGIDTKTKTKITNYTALHYKQYGSQSFGVDRAIIRDENEVKERVKVSYDDAVEVNDALKKIQKQNTDSRYLYRGVSLPKGQTAKDYVANFASGDTVANTKMLSTSENLSTAKYFAKKGGQNVFFVYKTKKGADVSGISYNRSESESVIPIGEKMTVVESTVDKSGNAVIFLTDND